ncbi:MAG: peptidoglycan editing factor PgeF [Desulfuromonadia bacterium]
MEQKQRGKIFYFEPSLAGDGVAAGFTTRHEGVSRSPYNSLNLGLSTNDSPHSVQGNRSLLARAFGRELDHLLTVTQVHGDDILVIDEENDDLSHFQKVECDGIVTNQRGIMIGVTIADCVPIILHDPRRRVVAALHAGWKGTALGIAAKGVETMVSLFGSKPSDIHGAIGPAIGPCCYEVDQPVRDAFAGRESLWSLFATPSAPGKWMIDLKGINRHILLSSGVSPSHLESSPHCVACAPETFFSYRRDNGETGRQIGFVMLV